LKIQIKLVISAVFLLGATGCNSLLDRNSAPVASSSPSNNPSSVASSSPTTSSSPIDPQRLEQAKVAVRLLREKARSKGFDPKGFDLLDEGGVNFIQNADKYCQALEKEGAQKVATDFLSALNLLKSDREKYLIPLTLGGGIAFGCPKYKDEFGKAVLAAGQNPSK
jgi:hypothetical protein